MKLTTKLTDRNIVMPDGKTDEILWDPDLIGFGCRLRVGAGGRILKQWLILYRHNGLSKRMAIGDANIVDAARARARAKDLLAEAQLGRDPVAAARARQDEAKKTLRLVVEMFIAEKENELAVGAIRPVTVRMLKTYLAGSLYLKSLHSEAIDSITLEHIADRVRAVSRTSGIRTAIGLRSALNNLFSWAMVNGKAKANPVIGTKNPKAPPSRDRVLNDAELASIWHAVDPATEYGQVVRLLMLTGCRREEVAQMRWSEFADGKWVLPASRSKNGRSHTLPLTPLMQEIINTVSRRVGVDCLFGKKGFTGWSLGKRALDQRLALQPWVHHDIRRSVATGMGSRLRIQPHIIEVVLNHASGFRRGVGGTYNRSPYETEVAEAMLQWSDHIALVTGSGGTKVTMLRPATA